METTDAASDVSLYSEAASSFLALGPGTFSEDYRLRSGGVSETFTWNSNLVSGHSAMLPTKLTSVPALASVALWAIIALNPARLFPIYCVRSKLTMPIYSSLTISARVKISG